MGSSLKLDEDTCAVVLAQLQAAVGTVDPTPPDGAVTRIVVPTTT